MIRPMREPTEGAARDAAERILAELDEQARRRLPQWSRRGPEDPGWVLLEAFAEVLGALRGRVDGLEARLIPRLLEKLGEEPLWASPATGGVVFIARDGVDEGVQVPAGTPVLTARRSGEAAQVFETEAEGWYSSSRLLRVTTLDRHRLTEHFPYPESGWSSGPAPLFGSEARLIRFLYLGDSLLHVLRDRSAALVLQWPGVPSAVVEGSWEMSVPGGWRTLHVEPEEVRPHKGKRALEIRIPGPIPDLSDEVVEGLRSPWLRLALPGARRVVLPPPAWVRLEEPGEAGWTAATDELTGPLPRAVHRTLSQGGDRWEDHSLSEQKIVAPDVPDSRSPSVYLGWERPVAASVYWSLVGRSAPADWGVETPGRSPRMAWEYSCGRGFRPLEIQDSTDSFTRSGTTSWRLPAEWTPQEHLGERLYWVRARWVSGAYRVPPVVRAVLPHAVGVRQGRTLSHHVTELDVSSDGRAVVDLSFPEGAPAPFRRIELRKEGSDWRELERAGSPAGVRRSGEFVVKRLPEGGYGIEVHPEWAGKTLLRISGLRVGLGSRGNLATHSLSIAGAELPGFLRLRQPLATDGGRDPEDLESYRQRTLALWRTGSRAVTPDDFRTLCRGLDPEVGRVEVAQDPEDQGRVLVTVIPREPCGPGRFSPERLAWMEERLQRKVPLGVTVRVMEAVYLPFEMRALALEPVAPPAESTRRALEARVRAFLHPLSGGADGRGFPAGLGLKATALSDMICQVLLGDTAERPPERREWNPRVWRLQCVFHGGVELPEALRGSGWLPARPLLLPVIERLVFEHRG